MEDEKKLRIGDLAAKANVTTRTVRYYENLGLLNNKTQRSEGGQRVYSQKDLLYLMRILQLKKYGLTLDEISQIISLGNTDKSGEARRQELIKKYKELIIIQKKKLEDQKNLLKQLNQNLIQLENSENSFKSCPGETCNNCEIKDTCPLAKLFFEKD